MKSIPGQSDKDFPGMPFLPEILLKRVTWIFSGYGSLSLPAIRFL